MEVEFYGCAKSLGLDSCHNCVGSEIVTIFPCSCYTSLSICLIYLPTPWLYSPLRALASWITDAHSSLSTAFSRHLLTCISRRSFGTSSSYRNLYYHRLRLLLSSSSYTTTTTTTTSLWLTLKYFLNSFHALPSYFLKICFNIAFIAKLES
jgi:hypothetical protein